MKPELKSSAILSPAPPSGRAYLIYLAFLIVLSSGCSLGLDTGDSTGDSTTGDTTQATGEANVNTTDTTAGGDVAINNQPDNNRNPDFIPGSNDGNVTLSGECFIEVYKPDSENGTASVLFSQSCLRFSEVCMFRRPLAQVDFNGLPVIPPVLSEQAQADTFEPFEEACGSFTSVEEGIQKWAFELPGRFYTGDIIATVAGQSISFKVNDPAERQEDVPSTSNTAPAISDELAKHS